MKKLNKVSIILATYKDDPAVLERSIKSVLSQDYGNLEIVVISGDIKKVKYPRVKVIYRDPHGISDAFNAGVQYSTGDYLYFLGAGDVLWQSDVIARMMEGVDSNRNLLVCGRIKRLSVDGKNILYTSSLGFKRWHLLYKMGMPHQGLFTGRKFFQKYGLFDTDCKYAMDYELLLRAYKHFPPVILKDVVVAGWRSGGVGTNKNLAIMKEYFTIRCKNRIAPVWLLWLGYLLSIIRYAYK